MVNFIEGVQEKVIFVVFVVVAYTFVGVCCCLPPVSVCRVDICYGVWS